MIQQKTRPTIKFQNFKRKDNYYYYDYRTFQYVIEFYEGKYYASIYNKNKELLCIKDSPPFKQLCECMAFFLCHLY